MSEQNINQPQQNAPAEEEINLRDILDLLISQWKWFALSICICLGIAFLYLKQATPIYTRTASVMIKDDRRGGAITESAAFQELGAFNIKSNVDNEILLFESKRLMEEVVRLLKLDVNYTEDMGLQTIDLYRNTPIEVSFVDDDDKSYSGFTAKKKGKEIYLSDLRTSAQVSDIDRDLTIKASLYDTISTPIGKLVIKPTPYFDSWKNEIKISKNPVKAVAASYKGRMNVSLIGKTTSSVSITLQDPNPKRAEDVINTLIDVYNLDGTNDKKKVAESTANFIDERLLIIGKELGEVDSEIANFKSTNKLTDISSEAQSQLQQSSAFKKEGLSLENQINLALFIKEYLSDEKHVSELLPANTGVADLGINEQIKEYNTLLLNRDRLIANSGNNSPVVQDLNSSLVSMRKSLLRSVDNLLASLKISMEQIREQENRTMNRIASVPSQEKAVISITRQQKIKEELYLYLLNKREENALSMAITENNARIIDEAAGSNTPIAPKKAVVLLAALIIGCIIPAAIIYLRIILNNTVRSRKDIEDIRTVSGRSTYGKWLFR